MRTMTLVLTVLACVLVGAVSAAEPRPNVVLILGDDQAWTDYGFMGHEVIQTPHLDRLAKQSLVYTHGYVPTSLCRASLMSLVTGQYAHQHGVTGNDPPKGTPREAMLKFVREAPTFPRLLSGKGYRTFQAGKWWEGSFREGGFTHGMTHGDPSRGGRHGDEGLKIGRQGLQPVFDFIEASSDAPFFVWYAPMLPHQPHNPPERLLAKYRDQVDSLHVSKYYAMCEWWDESCGQLLDYLDQKQLAENTIVIYCCDNGWIQQPDKPMFDSKSKRSPYDSGLRTPIMIRWPKKVEPQTSDSLVSTLSIARTVLDACQVPPPEKMAAHPALLPSAKSSPLFGETFEHDVVDLDAPAKSLLFRWTRDGDWKLIVSADGQQVELYNVAADPRETKNLAAENEEVVARLKRQLDTWWPGRE